MEQVNESLVVYHNERGVRIATWRDRYGAPCSIQESSLATAEACIWLGRDGLLSDHRGGRMHLTQDMVRELLPLLQAFVETGKIVYTETI